MTTNIVKSFDPELAEIKKIYGRMGTNWTTMKEDAIRIGTILWKCKAGLEHGSWLPFVEQLPFSERSARYYMEAYDKRERLKSATVADLEDGWVKALDDKPTEKDVVEAEEVKPTKQLPLKPTPYDRTTNVSSTVETTLKGELTEKNWQSTVVDKVIKDVKAKLNTALSEKKDALKFDVAKVNIEIAIDWKVLK